MDNILEVRNLSKKFPGFSLKDLSFELPYGYIMGFIGPNGAGKSTTIKLIMNLIRKDGGEVKLFGFDHIRHETEVKNRIGFVYDENYYYEELSVGEMTKIIARIYKEWDQDLCSRYLKRFGIPAKQKIKSLSKGMKMKFALVIALSHNADLLIMDEPTSGLDPLIRTELLEILSDLIQDERKGVLFSTHITSDLDKTADYITFINNGEMVFSETKEKIIDDYRVIKGPKDSLHLGIRNKCLGLKEHNFGFEGLLKTADMPGLEGVDCCMVEKPTLDDIMLYTVRGREKCSA